jgi:isopenicillin N synthase-like dioxygenase
MSFTSIPILDLALAEDPATKPAFLSDLRHALMEVGFLYLKNVGIPDELFQQVIKEGKAFFDIPTEEKYGEPHVLKQETSGNKLAMVLTLFFLLLAD